MARQVRSDEADVLTKQSGQRESCAFLSRKSVRIALVSHKLTARFLFTKMRDFRAPISQINKAARTLPEA